MILFIDNYDSFTYNLVDYLGQLEPDLQIFRNDKISLSEIKKLKPAGIVLSPGPGRPENAGICCEAISELYKTIPFLGVCLGHQCVAHVFGARIVRAPAPVHGKTETILHSGHGILEGVSSPFEATRYHSLVADRDTLKEPVRVTAESHERLVMALEHKDYPVYGVQFHPESILTREGFKIIENWLGITRTQSSERGSRHDAESQRNTRLAQSRKVRGEI